MATDPNTVALNTTDWPTEEGQLWEFKSSLTRPDDFAEKAAERISGFANSGGGWLLWGVDNSGDPDDGVDLFVGKQKKQPVVEWLDKKINQGVQPPPPYTITTIRESCGRGVIKPGKGVIAIKVEDGPQPPYQVIKKGTYFFRAGSHNEPAPHAIVEALWARRQLQRPILGFAAMDGDTQDTLVACSINATPAFNLKIEGSFEEHCRTNDSKGLRVIEIKNSTMSEAANFIASPAYVPLLIVMRVLIPPLYLLSLEIEYEDMSGNQYSSKYEGWFHDLVRIPQAVGASVARHNTELRETISNLQNSNWH